ncbi:hypothetical protein [Treponema sp. Marseille-Q4523]|uniref:hypothetical protein n=1 Tax=Treponema sp. Marseille-Q4523 TaxID=2810610 RepID=UPI0019620A48|nr:hypothetical protein [Treponema sp. Marseille-Q4523]MBM7022942.1 hypothetical protein [Treponema sp. Marseille-Q4523]
MNKFCYDVKNKGIKITDDSTVVIWENAEPEVALEVGKMYYQKESQESIDKYLLEHNCKRFWGNAPKD